MQKAEYRLMCEWVLHLLKQYSTYNLGQVNLAAADRLRAEAAAESYRCVSLTRLKNLHARKPMPSTYGRFDDSHILIGF